jgi:cell fate regulator YaaT (PSP1 superfamily)
MSNDSPKKIVNIRFRKNGKIYEFYTGNFVLDEEDKVIVETKRYFAWLQQRILKKRRKMKGLKQRPCSSVKSR